MENKQTKGRQKIEMKMITDEEDRLITFSKRRSGIYKKASELCTLCGAEIAVIVFSPAGNPFSFGHPCVDSIANRFLNQNSPPDDDSTTYLDKDRQARIQELNQEHNELLEQLEVEKARGEVLKRMERARRGKGWWEENINELGLHELEQMNASVEEFQKNLYHQMKKLNIGTHYASSSSSLAFTTTHPMQETYPIGAMNPAQMTNPFAPNTTETDINTPNAPHGYCYGSGFF